MSNAAQDPYTSKASESPSVSDKVQELLAALKTVQTSMLTTRAPDSDELHSRAMHAASTEGLQFTFFANKESGKMDGIEKDSHVNISYCQDGGTWISIAGKAEVSNDREKIAKLYNPMLKAWFGDNEKPNQRGDENDERIELIEVRPIEIRFFVQKRTAVGKVVDIVSSTVTGNVATPGGLMVLSGEELKEAQRIALSSSSK
ncbi:hypothetical protein BDY24DRAFT_373321 [Mrakia frigida]|uniref:uncharacterized protein n=1 Tax=Mrakia frigida TaxID=29902 RepID=UPI003FCC0BA0